MPAFDVISVRPAAVNAGSTLVFSPDGFRGVLPVQVLLRFAYQVEEDQIIGAPDWVKTMSFAVEAKMAPDDLAKYRQLKGSDRGQMLQNALVERFGLKTHPDSRELPVYELVVAKSGLKMQEEVLPPAEPGSDDHRRYSDQMRIQPGLLTAKGAETSTLVSVLSQQHLGRPVIDKTGLQGHYDFTLAWTPDGGIVINGFPAPPPPPGSPSEASIFSALQEQLGLKLEPRKDMLPVIVIDHIEKPTAN